MAKNIINNQKTKDLITAILALKNVSETGKFLRDLLTEREILEFSNRWLAARLLAGSRPYTEIIKKTGLSTRTVARISKWLKNGLGGYRLMIARINHHNPSIFKKG